jgi:hypothetical protein
MRSRSIAELVGKKHSVEAETFILAVELDKGKHEPPLLLGVNGSQFTFKLASVRERRLKYSLFSSIVFGSFAACRLEMGAVPLVPQLFWIASSLLLTAILFLGISMSSTFTCTTLPTATTSLGSFTNSLES